MIDEVVILTTTGFIERNLIGVLENCEGKVSTSVADLVNRELRASSPLYLRASCKDLEVGGLIPEIKEIIDEA